MTDGAKGVLISVLDGKEVFRMPTDPVCKMEINKKDAVAESDYKGQTYYFCSEDCRDSFDKHPEKYAEKEARKKAG